MHPATTARRRHPFVRLRRSPARPRRGGRSKFSGGQLAVLKRKDEPGSQNHAKGEAGFTRCHYSLRAVSSSGLMNEHGGRRDGIPRRWLPSRRRLGVAMFHGAICFPTCSRSGRGRNCVDGMRKTRGGGRRSSGHLLRLAPAATGRGLVTPGLFSRIEGVGNRRHYLAIKGRHFPCSLPRSNSQQRCFVARIPFVGPGCSDLAWRIEGANRRGESTEAASLPYPKRRVSSAPPGRTRPYISREATRIRPTREHSQLTGMQFQRPVAFLACLLRDRWCGTGRCLGP